MKPIFTLTFLLISSFALNAQNSSEKYSSRVPATHKNAKPVNFRGQWKGGFEENSSTFVGIGGNNMVYVLELNTEGTNVSGYSYTYFTEGLKKYYTICRLTGSLDPETKEIIVTEIERTKFNTPPEFRNCFQTHHLFYEKEEDKEVLRGTWVPAPNQAGDCGHGTTILSRRIVERTPLGLKPKEDITASKHDAKKHTVITPKETCE